jgi:hypothetical protein
VGAGKFLIKLTTMPAASEPSVEIILSQNSVSVSSTSSELIYFKLL